MKKDTPFECDEHSQTAFDIIKAYLTQVLPNPVKGSLSVLYIIVLEHSLSTLLAQENAEGKKNVLYYLSQMLVAQRSDSFPL